MTIEIIDDSETIAIGKLRLENSEIYFASKVKPDMVTFISGPNMG